jgi:hypothetical protein
VALRLPIPPPASPIALVLPILLASRHPPARAAAPTEARAVTRHQQLAANADRIVDAVRTECDDNRLEMVMTIGLALGALLRSWPKHDRTNFAAFVTEQLHAAVRDSLQ